MKQNKMSKPYFETERVYNFVSITSSNQEGWTIFLALHLLQPVIKTFVLFIRLGVTKVNSNSILENNWNDEDGVSREPFMKNTCEWWKS